MNGKVIIITGASSGIGKALALELHKRGGKVVLSARRKDLLDEYTSDWNEGDYLNVQADVTVETDCKRLVESALARFGCIDVLINNAGISMRALFEDLDLDVIRRLMDTNFWGTVYCSKYAIPHLLKSKGSLVGVSSIAGYKGLPGRTGYSASKFAMHGLLEVIRIENMKKGLHVLIACPGYTTSNIRNVALSKDGSAQRETPLDEDKLMPAEVVASAICKAIEKRRNTLVLTGTGVLTVFLNKFFPKLVDRLVYNKIAKEPDSPFK